MSLLPATSHVNPTTPFWATSAGSSGITSIVAGSGINVVNPTGAATTITNTGVRTLGAGTGITIGGTTTDRIVTNSGVTSIVAGSGITISGGTGAVTVSNNGTADIAPITAAIPAQSAPGGSAISLGTFTLGKSYQYAEGYGFLRATGGTFAAATTATMYLTSGTSAAGVTTRSISYILALTPAPDLNGFFFDLSQIKHYDSAGFTSVTLSLSTNTGGINVAFSPVGSTCDISNIATTTPVTTRLLTLLPGAAGFKFFTNI